MFSDCSYVYMPFYRKSMQEIFKRISYCLINYSDDINNNNIII